MADAKVLVGENTKEHVAFKLMQDVMVAENRLVSQCDRKTLLDLYAECLSATSGHRDITK